MDEIVQDRVNALREECMKELSGAGSLKEVEALGVRYLGKKGPLQLLMVSLRDVSAEERPHLGKLINDLKLELTTEIEERHAAFLLAEEKERLKKENLDISLPGRKRLLGHRHILTQSLNSIVDILIEMGFSIQCGPDIESHYYNFEALNFDEDHPAIDMQDTFYINSKVILRTHTSNVQVRVMEHNRPPIRVIAPGTAFRNEEISARSHVFFRQLEGFYIDRNVTFSDLLNTLNSFLRKLLGEQVETRFRPSYFPFVEPGLEVDVSCLVCKGEGCSICKQTGWLEVLGAGMIHPEVLKCGGVDPEEYSGFAWGMGIERLVMLLHGIDDIRYFTLNDLRFLAQFPG